MIEPTLSAPQAEQHRQVLGWACEAIQEAEAFLKSQVGFEDISKTWDYILGDYTATGLSPTSISGISANYLGKIALDLSSGLTDIKPFWEYRTFNRAFDQQAGMLGKLALNWWTTRLIDLKFSDVIKFALAEGSGYAHLTYNTELGDLDLIAEDARDVLPVHPSSYITIQDCAGVIVRRERTVNYVKEKYPHAAHLIKADRDGSYARVSKRSRSMSLLASMGLKSGFVENLLGGKEPALQIPAIPTVDLFTLYVRDNRKNESRNTILIGDSERNWSYPVKPGEQLYPRKRMIVFTRTAILYDGPNQYWHGLFPIPKLTLDPWPTTFLGKPILRDILPLQESLNKHLRIIDDHDERVARPGLSADKNSMSMAAMAKIDTRRAGLKLRHNPIAGKAVDVIFEPPLDPSIHLTVDKLIDLMDRLSGARDLSQIMKLGQIPSAETVEKILEAMTPAVRMRSRVIEAFMREVAMITASNFFQFYTTPQRLAVLGKDGLTFEDFDYDPGTLIPDFLGEDFNTDGSLRPEAQSRGPRMRPERARDFIRQFTYHIAPGSLLSASEITNKLLYIQLMRAGLMDIWSLFDKLGIANAGSPPEGANSIPERLMAMKMMGLTPDVNPVGRKASGGTMPSFGGAGGIKESK